MSAALQTRIRHIGHVARIGLIGDIHAEDGLLARALDFLTRECAPDALLCTGDIADGAGDIDRCCALLASYDVATVRGNHDRWLLTDRVRTVPDAHDRDDLSTTTLAYLQALPRQIEFDSVFGAGLLCHGICTDDQAKVWPGSARLDPERSATLDRLLAADRYRFLCNGHMHYRTLIHFQKLTLLNAGTLKPRHRPGFTVVDFERGSVAAFEFVAQHPQLTMQRALAPGCNDRIWHNSAAFDGEWDPVALYG